MLQRTLVLRLGLLIVGFVGGSIVAIFLLQSVLRDLDVSAERAGTVFTELQAVNAAIDTAEAELYDDPDRLPVEALHAIGEARRHVLEREELVQSLAGARAVEAFAARHDELEALLSEDAGVAPGRRSQIAAALRELRTEAHVMGDLASNTAARDLLGSSRGLRRLIVGLTVAALLMANISVIVLVRTGRLILRPVSALVEGSRELAAEHFDHRVSVDRDDEFAELARAYNHLAEGLQFNEERRIETLRQLAVTLNHETNNVINIIELQLGILDRRVSGDAVMASHLVHIREALHRIARTIASLRDLRRIVVTDYAPGMKMLDLARSTAGDPQESDLAGARGDDSG